MISFQGVPGRTVLIQEEEYLFFSGFSYLGLASIPLFQSWVSEGLHLYGVVFPSSRISNTQLQLYAFFEDSLARFIGLPEAAVFSSGYMASQAAVAYLATMNTLLYAPGVHPSLQLPGTPSTVFSGLDWQDKMIDTVNQGTDNVHAIILESVNPLNGMIQDFSWLKALEKSVRILIDDSHGIGILGQRGEGAMSVVPRQDNLHYLLSCSLAKAFSCEGGAVCGSAGDITAVKRLPYFTASTSMAPAFMHAWLQGGELFLAQLTQLRKNIRYFAQRIAGLPGFRHDPNLPVFFSPESALYPHCLGFHILLSAFRYPSDQDSLTVRMVLNALHTPEDLDRLGDCLAAFFNTR